MKNVAICTEKMCHELKVPVERVLFQPNTLERLLRCWELVGITNYFVAARANYGNRELQTGVLANMECWDVNP